MTKKPIPGVSRNHRISDEGLTGLDKHLKRCTKINELVVQQWVERTVMKLVIC